MENNLNINSDIKSLKLKILKENLKQDWNLDTDLWNEEFHMIIGLKTHTFN